METYKNNKTNIRLVSNEGLFKTFFLIINLLEPPSSLWLVIQPLYIRIYL